MVEQNLFFIIDSWDVLSTKQIYLYEYGSAPHIHNISISKSIRIVIHSNSHIPVKKDISV